MNDFLDDKNVEGSEPTTQSNQTQQQPQAQASNGLSVAALVCGILGIVGGFMPIIQYFTTVLSILAIIFGVKGKKQCPSKGLATAGFVLGVISIVVSVIGILCVVVAGGLLLGAMGSM